MNASGVGVLDNTEVVGFRPQHRPGKMAQAQALRR